MNPQSKYDTETASGGDSATDQKPADKKPETKETPEERLERLKACLLYTSIYHKPSEQDTFSTAYPECNGYNNFKIINIITDTILLLDIFYRITFV